MKVLFINKGDTMQELLGILYISSMLKQHGHTVELVFMSRKDPVEEARRFRPDVLAYSTTTGLHHDYLRVNREIKRHLPALSVFGGPHPTFFPEIIEEEGVDAVCLGEGEEAMTELVDRLAAGKPIDDVQNFYIRRNGQVTRNTIRPYVENLDDFPFPDRELFYRQDPFLARNPVKTIIARRGCPYKCTYCFNHYYHRLYHNKGKQVRIRSVDNVLEEIEQIRSNYPLQMLGFVDDHFLLSMSWLREFSEKYSKRFDIPFYCGVHVDQISETTCKLLRDAGCHAVYMGIEAGDDHIRKEILRRNISREQILRAASLVKDFGIKLFALNMIGFPGGTFQTDMKTLLLNVACEPHYTWVSIYQPYPRTDLGEYSISHGFYDGKLAELLPSYHAQSGLKFHSTTEKKQIERLHHFFDAMVRYPRLMPFFLLLTRLPFDSLYFLFYKYWFGYNVRFRIFRYRLSMKDFLTTAWRFLHTTHMPKLSQLKKND